MHPQDTTRTCVECGSPLPARNRVYCSKRCLLRANGRKNGLRQYNRVEIACEACGKTFAVARSRLGRTRACSKRCLGVLYRGNGNPAWATGIGTYKGRRKSACERCGANRALLVHHRNRNRDDNDPSNLETLCKRCHQVEHGCASNLPAPKLTEAIVREIRRRFAAGAPHADLAAEYGVSAGNVWLIVRRKSWQHVE